MSSKHKSKVYTKTGDEGKTSLLGGQRVFKHHLRISVYGDLDELNSHLGFLISLLDRSSFVGVIEFLKLVQHQIFDQGSYFACEDEKTANKFKIKGATKNEIEALELKMDEMDHQLMPLKNFVLPGGEQAAGYAHICRTVCRRVERSLTYLYQEEKMPLDNQNLQLMYINRLSDYFFVLSRWINFKLGSEEILWVPNKSKND